MAAYPQISRCITCLVAADDAGTENGCLEFAPGHHKEMRATGADGCLAEEIAGGLPWVKVPTAAGSLLWFHGLVPHRSGPNRTDRSRRALYLTYNALSEGKLVAATTQRKSALLPSKAPSRAPVRRASASSDTFRGGPCRRRESRDE